MSIEVQWFNQNNEIILWKVGRSWTIEDFYAAHTQTEAMIKALDYPVSAIVDASDVEKRPPDNLLPHFKAILSETHIHTLVYVSSKTSPLVVETLLNVLIKVNPDIQVHNLRIVRSRREALMLLEQGRYTANVWFRSNMRYNYESAADQNQANGLLGMLTGLLASVLGLPAQFSNPSQAADPPLFTIFNVEFDIHRLSYLMIVILSFLAYFLVQRLVNNGRLALASWVFVIDLVLIAFLGHVPNEAVGPTLLLFTLPIVAAGLLLPPIGLTFFSALVSIGIVAGIILEGAGLQIGTGILTPEETAFYSVLALFVNIIMLRTFVIVRFKLMDERLNLVGELEALNLELEERVAERTRDLEIAAEVSTEAATVLDPAILLPSVAQLTQEALNLYHVSIFELDEHNNRLTLSAGTGRAGQRMQEMGKCFELDSAGVIPEAARERRPVIDNDTVASTVHFKNSLLPDTRSEIAIPMLVGDTLIGVLDLQSVEPNRFRTNDVKVLKTLAERIGVSIRNAQLFAEVQAARLEAEKASSIKSQFLAGVSHELRTPLNSIINFTQFVSTGMAGDINAEQEEFLNNAINSGQHLLSLINDVLDISSIESGSLKLYVEDNVNLRKEAETVISAVSPLKNKQVDLKLDVASGLPLVTGDKRRLRQVILNLASNACKFTEQGHVKLAIHCEHDHVIIAVHDTGPGIAPDDQLKIFENFRQAEAGLRKGGGTGLGLPISKRLIEIHGGSLWLSSEVGKGSSFFARIPIRSTQLIPLVRNKA